MPGCFYMNFFLYKKMNKHYDVCEETITIKSEK